MNQGQANTRLFASGLKLLLQARELASDLERSVWDFAIEKKALNRAGITNNDLRSLICRQIVGHAYEVKNQAGPNRKFCTNAELALNSRSCFILTDAGLRLVQHLCNPAAAGKNSASTPSLSRCGSDDMTPVWDPVRYQLRLGSTIVKQYKFTRPNQETILAAFDEVGWPPFIENPLPKDPHVDAKTRLLDAIESLNRNQRSPRICFAIDSDGAEVYWGLTEF